ncbi:MAG: putative DNA binding domain-containing protein [Paludibacteraceae bacterium]|nr:putative DNA binding domain-containing protein [Paludibacteraceae bacterium]
MFPRESQGIEFKRLWKDDFFRELCAFANCQGGTLYIGVEDDGTVCGVGNAEYLLENLPNKIRNTLGLVAEVCLHSQENKEYVTVYVQPQETAVSFESKYFVRSGSTTQELRGQELAVFLRNRLNIQWDAQIRLDARLDDIDEEAVRYFVFRAIEAKRLDENTRMENTEAVLRKLKLMTVSGELTNAALMLFGKDIERWCPMPAFRIGRFGVNQADLMSDDNIICPLIWMPNRVIETLRNKYLVSTMHFQGMNRSETLEIPEDALREMLCNAIIHRDYESTFIQMRIWDDYMELWNPGTLFHPMTVENLYKRHESYPRNPYIAKVFYLAGLIENWGRGYEKIRVEFEKAHLNIPVFEQVRGGIMATIQREAFMRMQNRSADTQGITQIEQVTEQVKNLICCLQGVSMSKAELLRLNKLNKHGKVSRSGLERHYLLPAMEAGYVTLLYPDTPKHPKQKYILTEKGQTLSDTIL